MSLPARRMLNIVYRWALLNIEPERREEWERNMLAPVPDFTAGPQAEPEKPGRREPTPEELKADRDAFLAAMSGKGKM
jgi:hypothetical protein